MTATRPLGSYEQFHVNKWMPWWTSLIVGVLVALGALSKALLGEYANAAPYALLALMALNTAHDEHVIRGLARQLDVRRGTQR